MVVVGQGGLVLESAQVVPGAAAGRGDRSRGPEEFRRKTGGASGGLWPGVAAMPADVATALDRGEMARDHRLAPADADSLTWRRVG
ncbi:hypothetical protein ACIBIZ_51420 [Nonomuraea spiralis]|uniref:hypothetical protein n=1 Tax=Nonomuraea spiralis TaxID=46182 RepID=UPI00379D1FE2